MTNEQIALVQESFNKIEPGAENAAALFYGRLFEIDPALRPMFKGDLGEQGRKLMQMIGLVVRSLNRIDDLVPAIGSMGARHAGYGVEDRHYETVGAALLWTLEQGLGSAFTADVKDAWAAAYGLLSQLMKEAAGKATEHATAA